MISLFSIKCMCIFKDDFWVLDNQVVCSSLEDYFFQFQHSSGACSSLCKVEAFWAFPGTHWHVYCCPCQLMFRKSCRWDFICVTFEINGNHRLTVKPLILWLLKFFLPLFCNFPLRCWCRHVFFMFLLKLGSTILYFYWLGLFYSWLCLLQREVCMIRIKYFTILNCCTCPFIYVFMCLFVFLHLHICAYMCTCVHVHMIVWIYLHMCVKAKNYYHMSSFIMFYPIFWDSMSIELRAHCFT